MEDTFIMVRNSRVQKEAAQMGKKRTVGTCKITDKNMKEDLPFNLLV
jgi:hypothetical protein